MTDKAQRATLFEDRARIGDWQEMLSFRGERTQAEPCPDLRSARREAVPGRHLPNRTAPTLSRTGKHNLCSWSLLTWFQFATDKLHYRSIWQFHFPSLLRRLLLQAVFTSQP